MATPVVLPKQGNSVESCLITAWKKNEGDTVSVGEVIVEVETDKALFTIESEAAGTLLARFFTVGDDVPVMTSIAVIGEPGEDVEAFRPAEAAPAPSMAATPSPAPQPAQPAPTGTPNGDIHISPRALKLAQSRGVDYTTLRGTGPDGRIIERDVQTALQNQPRLTPAARQQALQNGGPLPRMGTGIGGRVTTRDLAQPQPQVSQPEGASSELDESESVRLTGIRARTAQRMYESLQSTAQLTLNARADARALLAYRERLKQSDEALGLQKISLNDLVMFAAARTLQDYPAMNANFDGETITQYRAVHLGFAVDLPRGLVVPVIRGAHRQSLAALSAEAKRLVAAAKGGKLLPDEMQGGTFTVTNLGGLGIETFTPILNPPQVAILGVGTIDLKPVDVDGNVEFVPHLALSLTIDHQALDGAPAARFLKALSDAIRQIDLVLAR